MRSFEIESKKIILFSGEHQNLIFIGTMMQDKAKHGDNSNSS